MLEKITGENLPNIVKEKVTQIQVSQNIPSNKSPKRSMSRYIKIKMPQIKDKGRIFKAARERQIVNYKGAPISLSADISSETLKARREWHEVLKVMASKNLKLRLLYPARISFKIDK